MNTPRFARNALAIGLQLTLLLAVGAAWAATTPVQRCQAAKIRAIGRYHVCRMQAEAKAVANATPPDFSRCDNRVQRTFARLEAKFGSEPIFGCSMDSHHVRTELLNMARRDSADMACRLGRRPPFTDPAETALAEGLASKIERPGSIVVVDFELAANPILSLRNTSNAFAQARCFYVSRAPTCVSSAEFLVDVPAQTGVTWPASQGNTPIPPVPSSIAYGYLVCVEVDDSGVAILGNRLIASVSDDNRCTQDGRPIAGLGGVNNPSSAIFDFDLCLGNQPSAACPAGADFEPCPYAFSHSLKAEMEGCWSTVSSFDFHCQ